MTAQSLDGPEKNNWCPGCGNFFILAAFKNAVVELGLEPEKIVAVCGVGCHGKTSNWLKVNGFHGIHGRVLPLATGMKTANPELAIVGFAGDSDQYDEGWEHFAHAARRNVQMTLIVHNNQVLGLTTGQATSTSLEGFKSKSTPRGATLPPFNPVAHAIAADCSFVARGFAGDLKHLQGLLVQAVKHPGFSYVDVLQPCVTWNYLNTYQWFAQRVYKLEEKGHDASDRQKALEESFEGPDKIPIGVFYKKERPVFQESFPHAKNLLKTENTDISPLLEKMK